MGDLFHCVYSGIALSDAADHTLPQAGQVLMMQLIQCIYTYQSLPVLLMHFAWQSPQFSLGTPDSTPN